MESNTLTMEYSIAVASGKGGTGKTTVSVSLYNLLSEQLNGKVQLIDCDVEEPNDLLFFQSPDLIESKTVYKTLPVIDKEKCTYCRKCVEYCEFNAIVVIATAEFAEINAGLCHSCGACLVACEDNAIRETKDEIGVVNSYRVEANGSDNMAESDNINGSDAMNGSDIMDGPDNIDGPNSMHSPDIIEGKLKIGSTMQTMLIRALKKRVPPISGITIYDAPPGTSCPVVETIVDADYVVLVTEPTPFGLHDLRLMVSVVKEIGKPYGVVINKAGLGNDEIYAYLEEQGSEILGEIPYSREFASGYASGSILTAIPLPVREQLERIAGTILMNLKT
jgi:MinD superfamily P-loop ATPase